MIRRPFGRDERPFLLKVPQWREVEKTCDAGLGVIAARLAPLVSLIEMGDEKFPGGFMAAIAHGHFGSARIDDVREPILQGLIGAGMTTTEAGSLVRLVFDESTTPMMEWAHLAFAVVGQALIGLPDEPLGEPTATGQPKARRRSRRARRAS